MFGVIMNMDNLQQATHKNKTAPTEITERFDLKKNDEIITSFGAELIMAIHL